MGTGKHSSQGFTLIASLLILVLLSGVAAGLLYLVTDEAKMGGNDLEANLAYYGAESAMEKMTSDLAALYQSNQSPQEAQITALATPAYYPTSAMVPGMNYNNQIIFPTKGNSVAGMPCTTTQANPNTPPSCPNTITSGGNAGLYAELTPMVLQVQATRPSGATVTMMRTVEVALIPVFQFGVFCGFDCSYFAGPNFSFGGRVHTNMNLFLASGADLVFNDKVQAFQQILTDELENGNPTTNGYGGVTYVPSSSGGCPLNTFPPVGVNCVALPGAATIPGDASWSGGYPTVAGTSNINFPNLSTGTFNGYLANSLTGVTNLQLPFVQNSCTSNPPPCTDPIAIVRKPLAGEAPTTVLGSERLYNKASIRILLADDIADLHPDWIPAPAADGQDVQFPSTLATNTKPFNGGSGTGDQVNLTAGGSEYVGFATAGTLGWVSPLTDAGATGWGTWPLMEAFATNPAKATGSWIRVEICITTPCDDLHRANWQGVTQEWLNLGFGRVFGGPPYAGGSIATSGLPLAPGGNWVDPNAILILQQLQPWVAQTTQAQAQASAHAANTSGIWYPINFYDAREGEMRDNAVNDYTWAPGKNTYPGYGKDGKGNLYSYTYSSCSVNGIMNAVELDVGNLNQWLQGKTGLGTGKNAVFAAQNGYVLYFSDHRGMRKDPNPSNGGQTPGGLLVYSGESGIEDVVNSGNNLTSTAVDGGLEPKKYYGYSPEDVDQNGFLDDWGEINLGYGFGINSNVNPHIPYARIPEPSLASGNDYSTYVDCAGYQTNPGIVQPWLSHNTDQIGMANVASGARHVLKLVDGGLGNVPQMPASSGCTQSAASPTGCGGFTIASENPVYIQGNYNSSAADPFWGTANNNPPTQTPHSAASIIADTVTVLSNQWSDAFSLLFPTTYSPNPCGTSTTTTATPERCPTADAYYRVAVSGGKNIPFPQPGWAVGNNNLKDFGTDGGMHNFLRYLENWGNQTLHFNGSLVSMYYSEYNTGTFKCCTVVYSPPTRDYYFDVLFLSPANLPPATPEFQDIVNLSYHQNFTPGNAVP
jgi:hypothetical protein